MNRRAVAGLIVLAGVLAGGCALRGATWDHQRPMAYADAKGRQRVIETAGQWRVRREAILRGMEEVMGELPDRRNLPPLEVRVAAVQRGEGYVRQTIWFTSEPGDRTPAYLYIPEGMASGERRPGLVALQPTGMAGKDIVDGQGRPGRGYAAEMARRGYVVIAPDYVSFGDYKDYDFGGDRYVSGTMKGIFNHMRCVDVLESLPQVDGGRIGVLGHSLGGHNALFHAAFDERVAVTFTSCGWTPFHYYYGGKKLANWAQDRYMPRVRDVYGNDPDRMPFDFQEVVAAIAPRAVFSSSPIHDGNFDYIGVQIAEPQIRHVYEWLGAEANFAVIYPDIGHDIPDDVRRRAYAFMDRVLRFEPVRDLP